MKGLIVFAALLVSSLAVPRHFIFQLPRNGRIVGGEDAKIEEVPYQVAMLRYGGSWCGGSIVRVDAVLTAAHCFLDSLSAYTYRAGSERNLVGGQLLAPDTHVLHEEFLGVETWFDYDIALVLLKGAYSLGSSVALIKLPSQDQAVMDGTIGIASGWGRLTDGGELPEILQKVNLPVVNQEVCAKNYRETEWDITITSRMMCAGYLGVGGKDACQGDSGGPFVSNGELLGVTSWGMGCADPDFPGVWARVPSYVNWIETTLNKMKLRRMNRAFPSDLLRL